MFIFSFFNVVLYVYFIIYQTLVGEGLRLCPWIIKAVFLILAPLTAILCQKFSFFPILTHVDFENMSLFLNQSLSKGKTLNLQSIKGKTNISFLIFLLFPYLLLLLLQSKTQNSSYRLNHGCKM